MCMRRSSVCASGMFAQPCCDIASSLALCCWVATVHGASGATECAPLLQLGNADRSGKFHFGPVVEATSGLAAGERSQGV